MIFTNAKIFINGAFKAGSFEVSDGRFGKIYEGAPCPCPASGTDDMTDLKGALVIPGLIDLHGHGNSGYDFSTCSLDGLKAMALYLGRNGITSFAPASMTMSYEYLEKAFENGAELRALQSKNASAQKAPEPVRDMSGIAGINMEGPYFSYGKRGAQDPAYLKKPDFEGFKRLYDGCGGMIRLVDVAPELEGAMDFIRKASDLCTVSVAHTQADYDTVKEAFRNGASQMTHLFNGMEGIHHRAPGPVCAAFDTPGVFVELICDGVHVAPPVIRMVFELFRGRVILISDALACCGMPDGIFKLGAQTVTLKDKHAFLPDGTLAGSACCLFDMLKNAVSFGIPMEEAINSATINPAIQLGLDHETGSIAEGKKADFLICSENLLLKSVYIDGNLISGSSCV